jgi:hypothetical protein
LWWLAAAVEVVRSNTAPASCKLGCCSLCKRTWWMLTQRGALLAACAAAAQVLEPSGQVVDKPFKPSNNAAAAGEKCSTAGFREHM